MIIIGEIYYTFTMLFHIAKGSTLIHTMVNKKKPSIRR